MVAAKPPSGDAGSAGCYGPPGTCAGLDFVLACAAEADGLAERDVRAVLGRPEALAVADAARLDAGADADGRPVAAAVVGGWVWSPGVVAGLNVATESMAPATRQTARMLASNGSTVPCPNGAVSRRSRFRRRLARSSRW